MPVFCPKCNQFFKETDIINQVIEYDRLGYKQYVYYHLNHCPEKSEQIPIFTGKELFELLFKNIVKRACTCCGNEIESSRPDTKYCTHCGRVKAYKTLEYKRNYMKEWRLKKRKEIK